MLLPFFFEKEKNHVYVWVIFLKPKKQASVGQCMNIRFFFVPVGRGKIRWSFEIFLGEKIFFFALNRKGETFRTSMHNLKGMGIDVFCCEGNAFFVCQVLHQPKLQYVVNSTPRAGVGT